MSIKFLQVSERVATAQVRKPTMRWGELEKKKNVKDNFANNISKRYTDAQQDAASAALVPRRCLEIILDCSRISAPDADAKVHTLPFLDHEVDELERILVASARSGAVDFRFFKVVSLALLTYESIEKSPCKHGQQVFVKIVFVIYKEYLMPVHLKLVMLIIQRM